MPFPVSIEDELISYFTSDKLGKKKWFTRKMKGIPFEQQEEIWSRLQSMGYERPATKTKKNVASSGRTFITWSEEEWDHLAGLVWQARKIDPSETLVGLVRVSLDSFSPERRRNIRVINEIRPLIERLSQLDEKYQAAISDSQQVQESQHKIKELEDRLSQFPSRESILSSVTDEEVVVFFGEKVLSLIAPDDVLKMYQPETLMSYIPFSDMLGYVMKSGLEMLLEKQNQLTTAIGELTALIRQQKSQQSTTGPKPAHTRPSMPIPKIVTTKLMRVTVIGLLADQQRKIEQKLSGRAQFNFVDKNRSDYKRSSDAIPDKQDIIVLAANFINHSIQDQAKKKIAGTNTKLIVHHGGIETMVRKLDEVLPQLEFA